MGEAVRNLLYGPEQNQIEIRLQADFFGIDIMIDDIASGKLIFDYNLLGSYSFTREKRDNRIGVVIPQDYALSKHGKVRYCQLSSNRITFLYFLLLFLKLKKALF